MPPRSRFCAHAAVLMTALAMIIGMVPWLWDSAKAARQNAPLGRAVIGGLIFATFATLFFVPCVFSMIHGRRGRRSRNGGLCRRNRFEIFLYGMKWGWGDDGGGVQMDDVDQEQPRGKGSRVFTILFIIVIVLVVLGAVTLFQRRTQYQALAKETETRAIPTVAVIHASVESAEEDLVSPAQCKLMSNRPSMRAPTAI